MSVENRVEASSRATFADAVRKVAKLEAEAMDVNATEVLTKLGLKEQFETVAKDLEDILGMGTQVEFFPRTPLIGDPYSTLADDVGCHLKLTWTNSGSAPNAKASWIGVRVRDDKLTIISGKPSGFDSFKVDEINEDQLKEALLEAYHHPRTTWVGW